MVKEKVLITPNKSIETIIGSGMKMNEQGMTSNGSGLVLKEVDRELIRELKKLVEVQRKGTDGKMLSAYDHQPS